jgi:radical SAM superfamily enzyme YgiQ (UPF0313 family)
MREDLNRFPIISLISLYGIENGGVRHISSMLKKYGFTVNVIFFKKWINNNIKNPTHNEINMLSDLIVRLNTDLIGIGFGSPYFKIAKLVTENIRQKTNAPIVWGGIHSTIMPEDCIEVNDIICVGEGEYPMLELAQRLLEKKNIDDIKNLWIKEKGCIKKNPLRPLICDLNELPYRDFEQERKYWIENDRIFEYDPIKWVAEFRIMASRGCPYHCSYCYNSALRSIYIGKGDYFRKRSVENVLDELLYAKRQIPRIKRIKFDDDTFVFGQKWIDEFCRRYKSEINLPFDILLNPEMANYDTLWKLKRAGLKRVQVGIQTGSETEAKEVYERPLSNRKILEFSQMNKHLGLDVIYDVILDDPLATESDKEELFKFIFNLPRPYKLFLYSLTVFPKTALAEKLLRAGMITEDEIEGRAAKSFYQFRLSMDYSRSKEDAFLVSLLVLMTKNFIPKRFIGFLRKRKFFKRHPLIIEVFARLANIIKLSFIGFKMLIRGELTCLKIREYGSLRNLITQ